MPLQKVKIVKVEWKYPRRGRPSDDVKRKRTRIYLRNAVEEEKTRALIDGLRGNKSLWEVPVKERAGARSYFLSDKELHTVKSALSLYRSTQPKVYRSKYYAFKVAQKKGGRVIATKSGFMVK